MGREAGFGVNRLSTKRVHHTAKNARFHGYRMDTAPAKQVLLLLVWLVLLLQRSRLKTRSYVLWGGAPVPTRSHPFP